MRMKNVVWLIRVALGQVRVLICVSSIAFKYLTPKIRLEASSLPLSLLFSRTFHMVCSGARCKDIVSSILQRRAQEAAACDLANHERPVFVWEPFPDLCMPSELETLWEACAMVDVVSPNEEELAAYFDCHKMDDQLAGQSRTVVEEVMAHGIGPEGNGVLVVRAGRKGCVAFADGAKIQLPPYYLPTPEHASNGKVVDPTGGGNTFLGGLCKALTGKTEPSIESIMELINGKETTEGTSYKTKERVAASLIFANVAASFAIEQAGVPSLSEKDGKELWNQETFKGRVETYVDRERRYIEEQLFR